MSREKVLADVRAALGATGGEAVRRGVVAARLADPPDHIVPARSLGTGDALANLFKAFLGAQGAEVIEVAQASAIPAAVVAYLRSQQLPLRVRSGADHYLAEVPWENEVELTREGGPAHAGDAAGLSLALAGVAETGTLVLASGADNPVTLAFLPDTHIVIVRAETIVGSYEEAMSLVQREVGAPVLPRTLNLVSGASRTADIGGKIVQGAHGPRRLAVFVVGVSAAGSVSSSADSSAGSG